MRVTIVRFDNGDDPMYFINGRRDHDIQGDDQLLNALVGETLEYIERIGIKDQTESELVEAYEDLWYTEREEDLYAKLETHPELES